LTIASKALFVSHEQRKTITDSSVLDTLSAYAGTSFAYWNIDKCEFVNFDDYQYVSNNLSHYLRI